MSAYEAHVEAAIAARPLEEAMAEAVGGDFLQFGLLERCVLEQSGLADDAYLIDVGCGSGRLALALSHKRRLRYLGVDVIPALLDYAKRVAQRDDWSFVPTTGLTIPEKDGAADMVCFFSVFTHLRHEETFAYLSEGLRVLKPGGRIVFSFLDFGVADHWSHFEAAVRSLGTSGPMVTYMEPRGIQAWAARLDCALVAVFDDNTAFVEVERRLGFVEILPGVSHFGQSVAVYEKRS